MNRSTHTRLTRAGLALLIICAIVLVVIAVTKHRDTSQGEIEPFRLQTVTPDSDTTSTKPRIYRNKRKKTDSKPKNNRTKKSFPDNPSPLDNEVRRE